MRVTRLTLRDFRSYGGAEVRLGSRLTVVSGRNGAGKTNLLEALYFACTGRSCRTANERECVRFGAYLTRLEIACEDDVGSHRVAVGFAPGEPKRMQVDGADVERLAAGGGGGVAPPRRGPDGRSRRRRRAASPALRRPRGSARVRGRGRAA